MVKAKRLKREELNIKMFREIEFGDPSYFDEFTGDRLNELVYCRNFKNIKGWVAKGFVEKVLIQDTFEGEDVEFEENSFRAFFAINNTILNSIIQSDLPVGRIVCPSIAELKEFAIGVDTAEYLLSIDNNLINVNTMSDGQVGLIIEVYLEEKLVGIIMDIGFGEYEYEDVLDSVKHLFNLK